MSSPTSPFPGPHTPTFGRLQNVPFIFNTPPPQESREYPWQPSAGCCSPKSLPQNELKDVDMPDASPPRPPSPEKEGDEDRAIALGGLKRVYNSRQKARSKSKLAIVTMRKGVEDHDSSDDSDEEIVRDVTPITQNTSNHYTLNLPGPAPTRSDLPYVLLGYVY